MPNLTEKWLHDHFSGLTVLETLEITSCYMLKRLKLSSRHHHLKSLGLSSCDNMVEVMVDSPILCGLSYYGNTSNISISLNASDLLEVKYLCGFGYRSWNAERIKFLSKMGNLKVFELSSFSLKGFPYLIIYLIHKVFGLGFFFFFCWHLVEVEQWWRSNGGWDREREMERNFFGFRDRFRM